MSFRTAYGYSWSENGWRMCNRDECDLVRIPGLSLVETAPIRKGAPLIILGAFLKYYDTHVDEITSSVWGWSATNDVATSNHLAGTAVDINAPKYPWGARTMPAERIRKVRAALNAFEGSVFWGADWDRADEMHFQLAWEEGDPRNDAFAKKLQNGYLGIYGSGSAALEGDDDVSWLSEKYENFKKTPNLSYKDWFWWTDKNISEVWDQLRGVDGKGWSILGKSKVDPKRDNTLVEAVAEIKADLAQLRKDLGK